MIIEITYNVLEGKRVSLTRDAYIMVLFAIARAILTGNICGPSYKRIIIMLPLFIIRMLVIIKFW